MCAVNRERLDIGQNGGEKKKVLAQNSSAAPATEIKPRKLAVTGAKSASAALLLVELVLEACETPAGRATADVDGWVWTAGTDTLVLVEAAVVELELLLELFEAPPVEGVTGALTSLPVPHGIAGLPPSGWFAWGGEVVWPEALAMVHRVVHCGLVVPSWEA